MIGYLILNGGAGFTPNNKNFDYEWLQVIRRLSQSPRVVVVPAATPDNAIKAAQQAVTYLKGLGSFAEYAEITNRLSANTGVHYEVLNKVEVICLTDGSPANAVEILQGTHTEAALRRALLERKAAVAATGASAMALGSVYWLGGVWEQGLGVVPHLAVLPHHQLVQMRLTPERLLAELPAGITILGIDDATGVIAHPDGTYQVAGRGEVVVYRSVEQQDTYTAGQQFTLGT